jgi:putative MFS transporter
MVAFTVGYVLNESTHLGWRFILGTSTFIAAILFISRFGLPESPRWLWNQKRFGQARNIA